MWLERRESSGQSTVEYLILVALVVAATLVFLSRNGIFQQVFNKVYEVNINHMLNLGEEILK